MQVFIVGTPYETAHVLDIKRFNKQMIENQQIMELSLVVAKVGLIIL